jgi:hypothetical protein
MSDERPEEPFLKPSQLKSLLENGRAPNSLRLRGAVVEWRERGARLRVVTRDSDYGNAHAAEVDVPVPSAQLTRGTEIDVVGKLVHEWSGRLSRRTVLQGTVLRVGDKAEGLVRREARAAGAGTRDRKTGSGHRVLRHAARRHKRDV